MSGISIRQATSADADGIAKVHVDSWRSTYTGVVPQSYLDALTYEERAKMWRNILDRQQPRWHLFVAVDKENRIVGFSSGGGSRDGEAGFDGEIYAIYLLRELQGQGIGKQLFAASVNQLVKDGYSGMMLWVLKENPACAFYSAMGGSIVSEKVDEIGGKSLVELAFGWSHIKPV